MTRFQGIEAETILPLQPVTGVLMVKFGGTWMRVDCELPQPRVQRLH